MPEEIDGILSEDETLRWKKTLEYAGWVATSIILFAISLARYLV